MVNYTDIVEFTSLPYTLIKRGKVRDIYQLNEQELLIVSTDRVSAFDVILPTPIPQKGIFLNKISQFFFKLINQFLGIKNHLQTEGILIKLDDNIRQRSSIVKKAEVIKVECIARGYLVGSLYQEYKQHCTINGVKVEKKYKFGDTLDTILFTPTTKEETGHDRPITIDEISRIYGEKITTHIVSKTVEIYEFCKKFLVEKGIILVDTKLEWGIVNGEIVLVDEVLTPDSSRFWLKENIDKGDVEDFYDKQLIRNYLSKIGWDKKPPAPGLPDEIIKETAQRYEFIYRKIVQS
ncbi:MAG: phosphoribosylaminoimidazolesuccinocarboxamide synthase [Planctomycetota bacterium]